MNVKVLFIKGTHYFNSTTNTFDYEGSTYKDPLFKYKSVAMVSFIGQRIHDNPQDEKEVYSIDTVDFETYKSSYKPPNTSIQRIVLQHQRQSLPTNKFNLIMLNFNFEDDAKIDFRYTREKLKSGFSQFESPAKINLFATKSDDNESILQISHSFFSYDVETFRLSLKETLPIQRGINFHLLIHEGFMLAAPLLRELINTGFQNCFVVSYIGNVEVMASYEEKSYHPIKLYDFRSRDRRDVARKKIIHNQDKPGLPDNKIITYWAHGSVRQEGYRDWIKSNPEKYSLEYRKNLWIQNTTAIITEMIHWLESESTQSYISSDLRKVLCSLANLVTTFHQNILENNFAEVNCLTF